MPASQQPLSRRQFLQVCSLGLGSAAVSLFLPGCSRTTTKKPTNTVKKTATPFVTAEPVAHETISAVPPVDALTRLMEGNHRFQSGTSQYSGWDAARRAELLEGQAPFAAILTCSDSRVPPELLFDQGLGDLFVIRTAGNVPGPVALGSLEYAVEHLGLRLVVVLGHQKCGAVSTAVTGSSGEGSIVKILQEIQPAVDQARGQSGEILFNSINANILKGVQKVQTQSAVLAEMVLQDQVEVVGARYDLDTNRVEWLHGPATLAVLFPEEQPSAEGAGAAAPATPLASAGEGQSTALITPVPEAEPELQPEGKILGVHVVRRGETLSAIANTYGISLPAIVEENKLADPNRIYTGQRLRIPNVPGKATAYGPVVRRQF